MQTNDLRGTRRQACVKENPYRHGFRGDHGEAPRTEAPVVHYGQGQVSCLSPPQPHIQRPKSDKLQGGKSPGVTDMQWRRTRKV